MKGEVLTREKTGRENDVPHPALASNLPVEVAGHIARDAAGQGIQQDGCRVNGSMTVHIEHAQQRHDNNAYRVAVENSLGLTYISSQCQRNNSLNPDKGPHLITFP